MLIMCGVMSFTSTSTHKSWTSGGCRNTRVTHQTTSASAVARRALVIPMEKRVVIVKSLAYLFVVKEATNFVAFFGGELFGFDGVKYKWHERAIGQFVGQRFELVAGERFARDGGAKLVREGTAIAGDESFLFQPLQQFLHGRLVGRCAARVERVADCASREGFAVPEQL